MKNLLFVLALSWSFGNAFFSQNSPSYSRVKINTDEAGLRQLSDLGVTIDHGIRKEGVHFISDFSHAEIEIMQAQHFNIEILIPDVVSYYEQMLANPSQEPLSHNGGCAGNGGGSNPYLNPATPSHFNLGTMGGYLKYNEMLAELDEMATTYPNLITVKAPISNFLTFENRPIYYVRLSDNANVDEGEPKVLYSAIHHAREPMALMETIFYMWFLLENYGTNDEVTYLVNNLQLYFVPCLNPDGYVYNETTNPNGGGMWRKNRRNNGGGVYGVDLNRNYGYGWGTTGTSNSPSNDTYCGPAVFSEPETQAMRWLVQQNHFITAFNAHTYAKDILFPIGTTTAEFAPHHNWFQAEANHQVQYNGYTAMKSSTLYPASGDSDDYMYKLDIGVGQKDTIFAHTPEVGTAFWQPSNEIIPTCKEMLFPNLVLAHLARVYAVTSDTDPNMIANINGNFNHSIKRLGRESGPVTVSISPIQNIVNVGVSVTYTLAQLQTSTGAISYSLNPNIQFGDQIIYVLETNNGLWIKRDTIYKTFGALTSQVLENATSAANWTGTWSTTSSTYVSPTKSFTDSPGGNYSNNANKTTTYVPAVDLTNASSAMVRYYAKWDVETDYDYVQFLVSTDNGTTWIPQCGNYTVNGTNANGSAQPNNQPVYEGTQANWVLEEINLSDYLGQTIKFRFKLGSDGGTVADGFYFDDFEVLFNVDTMQNAPTAAFSASSDTVCLGIAMSFNDASANNPTSWSWNFGDGTMSSSQNPSHLYQTAGNFVVSLSASNVHGTGLFIDTVTVLNCAGISAEFMEKGFIAPNPFSEFLTISGLQEGMKVRIFNLYGTLLYDGTASKKMEKIETDKWASGSYFVEVYNADQRSISLIVKQ
ncbi:MAG: PKD domain-containing protein [Synechococcaceae bacterium WB7_1C_051]|nr:PKD domain-containing protein [Synechococcaceae bacterium WB7_1C_051]